MEEISEGREEEDRVDLDEGFVDARKFVCNEGACQDVFESDEAREKHIRESHYGEFDFVEYKDPLTEDTNGYYDRKSQCSSTDSGISGQMKKMEIKSDG